MLTRNYEIKLLGTNNVIELKSVINLFHKWIRESETDERLIDVVDYSHLTDSPKIMLIGNKYSYTVGYEADGSTCFIYRNVDRDEPDILTGFNNAFSAASRFQEELSFVLNCNEFYLTFYDINEPFNFAHILEQLETYFGNGDNVNSYISLVKIQSEGNKRTFKLTQEKYSKLEGIIHGRN